MSGLWPGLAEAVATVDCSSVEYCRYAPTSRRARPARRHPRCDARLSLRTASGAGEARHKKAGLLRPGFLDQRWTCVTALVHVYAVSAGATTRTRWCHHPQLARNAAVNSTVHPKYKMIYRVGNWTEHERSLVRCGDVTFGLGGRDGFLESTGVWLVRRAGTVLGFVDRGCS